MPEKRKKKNLKSTKHAEKLSGKKPAAKKTAAKRPSASKVKKTIVATKKVTKAKVSTKSAAHDSGSLTIFDLAGKKQDQITLDPIFQEGHVNKDVIYQAVVMYQAGKHLGTSATKDRGHVSGGGKKPWKQKGTGRARHGSSRSPIWRHGGVTFGPMPRDYSYTIPQQIRQSAVVETVKDKVQNGKLVMVGDLNILEPKTKLIAKILDVFKLEKPLMLVDAKSDNLMLASRNIREVSVKTANEVNALDIAGHRECLMTKAAYAGLLKRLKS